MSHHGPTDEVRDTLEREQVERRKLEVENVALHHRVERLEAELQELRAQVGAPARPSFRDDPTGFSVRALFGGACGVGFGVGLSTTLSAAGIVDLGVAGTIALSTVLSLGTGWWMATQRGAR